MEDGFKQQPEELLSAEDVGRVFDIAVKTGNPELVADLVMSAFHLRNLMGKPTDDDVILRMYDMKWKQLRAEGAPEPVPDDPRRSLEPMLFLGTLRPDYLFKPRTEVEAEVSADLEATRQGLAELTLESYQKLSSENESDASFLLSLVGASVVDGEINFAEISPERLKQVQELVVLMDPEMRNFYRMNLSILRMVRPSLARSLDGIPIIGTSDEALLAIRRQVEAIVGEWAVKPDSDTPS